MITKQIITDQIEIVGPYRHVQVRTATVIEEDGVELSRSFHRHVVAPTDDYSNETAEVQAVCQAVFTPEVIEAYENSQNEAFANIESEEAEEAEEADELPS
jgi:hypothetical protein